MENEISRNLYFTSDGNIVITNKDKTKIIKYENGQSTPIYESGIFFLKI